MFEPPRFKVYLLSAGIGAAVFTLLGTFWAVFGVWSLGSTWEPLVAIVLAVCVVALTIVIVRALREVKRLPQDDLNPEMRARVVRVKRAFGLVNVIQGVAIGVVFAVGFRLNEPEYIPPVVALIVGLHFFALAPILRMNFDYLMGAVLCLVALATILLLPEYIPTPPNTIFLWGTVVGLSCAATLWLGAVSRIRLIQIALRRSQNGDNNS
jgi:MFS family permease